uniref:Putative neural-cadherin 2-like n=1 Tax=Neolamprologus brichardi TaxID=32507 RepID=A0A3Q4H9I0_NEOBR
MIWGVLLCCLLTPAAGYEAQERLPFFHGHVFENSPPCSKVNGLIIPVRRITAQKWCPVSGTHFKLYGNGSEAFRAFAHHKRGSVLLRTSRVLDRETRSEYLLSLGLCCQTCAPGSVVFDVASVKVDVLDTNDHKPTFRSADNIHISLHDTTALRSEVLLVDSILGLPSKRWATRPAELAGTARAGRSPRALLDPGSVVSLNVSEDASIGSVITSLSPTRFQSASYELIYPESESSPVSVGRDSGDITITRRLDREAEADGHRGGGAVESPDWYLNKVKLKITDVNDNVPDWNMKPYPYLAVVSPEAPAGTFVYQLQAHDGDEGKSGEVEYFLSDGGDGCFAVDKKTGQVVTTGLVLQREREYLLSVVALDGMGSRSAPAMLSVVAGARAPQFTNTSYVQVLITDENDCVPEFLQSIYSVDGVPETVTTATSLLQVLATDCDSGLNAELTYYTLSPDFSISPHGTVFPARRLDYERPNHLYEFVVMAVDSGDEPHSGTATVRVRMANVNDEAPEFSQPVYRTFVSEDAGPNTLVATVLAKDPDGDAIFYSITAGNEEENFVIDSQKGLIRLRSTPLPKLQGLEYVLNVTATDDNASGGPHPLSSTARVIVGVDDVNNNKPIFEEVRKTTLVLLNFLIVYLFTKSWVDWWKYRGAEALCGIAVRVFDHYSVFTGVIVTARRFDRERQREYSITVTATDWAEEPLIGICQLTIQILDQNDNSPKFENLRYEYFLREDTLVGTSFLRVAAHDDDFGTNAAITYAMSLEQPEYLQVNPITGWVYVNQPISQRTYITRDIIATDGGNRSTSVELAVTITNVKNQPPQWEKESYSVVIPENTARDTPIVTVKATSQLGDPRVTYNLEDGMVPETNMPVRFYLSPNREDGSASILVSEPLDYETTPFFSLQVRAQNVAAVPLAAFTRVYVNITDVNDNVPFFTSSIYEASVTEGAQIGTSVLQVSAHDKDLGLNGEITYSLLSDSSGDHNLFRIDPELGIIYTEAVFDREARSSYLLEVQSEDEGVKCKNDAKHIFKHAFLIPAAGANAKLRYQITSGNKGGVFDIEPEVGTIFIAQPLDYEQQKRYKLLILASDGKWEDYAAVVVTVVNKNDEAPVFSMNEYYGSVTEDTGTISVAAEGLDRERADTHHMVVEARDGGGMTGTATVTIVVTDINDHVPKFREDRCGARVPESAKEDAPILELSAVDPDAGSYGHLAFSVMAGDPDQRFYMVSHRLEQRGTLRLKKKLDFEQPGEQRFNLTIKVEDTDFSSQIHCLVLVEDENDNAPVFTPGSYLPPPLPEDVTKGTSVIQVVATDSDSGPNGDISYSILPESDPYGHFAVSGAGVVTVARPLDRETVAGYELVVMATDRGTPPLSGSVTVRLPLLDVNDNGPELETAYIPMLWENSPVPQVVWLNRSSTLLYVTDKDSPEQGPPFYLSLPSVYSTDFHLQDHGNGSATLTALRRFDRERQSEFHLPVIMIDSGEPPMTATNTLTITIGDHNDNAHQAGEKDVYVHSYKGRIANAALGKVYAPDPDDWDNKTYTLETSAAKYFSVDQSSGELSLRQNIPGGSYWLRVEVSDGVWPDVVSGVRVHVRELEEKAIVSSASLRITAKDFIDSRVEGKSRLEAFWDFLSETLSVRPGSINVFSIADRDEKTVDIHFNVLTDNGYLRPEKLHGVLDAHKKKLQSVLRANVHQVQVDECVHTDCKTSGGCSTQLSIGDSPTLIDSGALSLVSVKVTTLAVCGCAAREMTHQRCSTYSSNPCLNGGTCIDTQNGYRCQCPPQLEGPDCQQMRVSFLGNGYAWFPPIRPCFDSHLSLEFMTEEDDGLLLYAGPMATLMPGDSEDYMAIELIGGTPSLKINHGSGTLVLQLTNNVGVADRRWHRLDVRSNSKEVRFTLDRCSTAIVMETEGVDSWAMTEDRSSCEIRGFLFCMLFRYFNGSHVLQLGGINENMSYEYPQLQHKHYTGCIRNLRVDSKLYDLGSPAESYNTLPGCTLIDDHCASLEQLSSCGKRGHCHGDWGSLSCLCEKGFTGPQCDQVAREFSFDGRSHIQFHLLWSLPARQASVEVGVRTRAAAGVILSLLSQEQNEYLRLEVSHDRSLPSTLTAMIVELYRYGREFTLRLDRGGGRREVTASPGQSREIIIDPAAVMLGNSFPSGHNRSFVGCLRDLRFNGRSISLDEEQPSEGIQVVTSQGVSVGCASDACRKHHCSPPLVCVDLWRHHECRCICVYTLCASRPCRHGTCVAHSPSRYSCRCSEGYRGRHCEVTLAMFHEDSNSLSLSSMFAISILLMLGLFLYSCWRRHKGLKEGVYHVSAHHGEWEDIRENVLNYDEEGGGEQDQPAQDNNKNGTSNGNGSAAIALRLAIPPSETETLPSPLTFRRSQKTLSFSSQDLARYLCEVIRDMDRPEDLGTMTTPRRPAGKERGLAGVRSLSSLSATQGSEVRLQAAPSTRLDRFKNLRAVVSDLRRDSKTPEGQRDKLKESRGQPNCEKSG